MRLATHVLAILSAGVALGWPAGIEGQSYRAQGVTPIFDGWEELPDGSRLFYFGYINRSQSDVNVPVGPDNAFDQPPADRGQPTTFLPGRHEHVFTIPVPAKTQAKLAWSIKSAIGVQVANASFDQLYILEVRENDDPNAKPPSIRIADIAGRVGEAVVLSPAVTAATSAGRSEVEGAAAEAAGLNVEWSKHRGPGAVTFSAAAGGRGAATGAPTPTGRGRGAAPRPGIQTVSCGMKPGAGCGAVAARFAEPGVYVLRAAARQDGLQSVAFARVTVTP